MSATVYEDPGLARRDLPAATQPGSHTHRRISVGRDFRRRRHGPWPCNCCSACSGAGIGLGNVDVGGGNAAPDANSFGIGAGVWWIVSSVVALLFGSFVSAWLAGIEIRWDGVLHGLITWGIASLLTIYLLTSAIGGIIGGGASALGGIASAAGSGIKSAAQPVANAAGITPDVLQQQVQAYLKPADADPATMTPQDAQKQIGSVLVTYAKGGAEAPAAHDRIVAIMAAQQHVSTEQASRQFDDAQAKLEQARTEAIATAKTVAKRNGGGGFEDVVRGVRGPAGRRDRSRDRRIAGGAAAGERFAAGGLTMERAVRGWGAVASCLALAGCGLASATPPQVEVMSARLVGLGLPEQQLSVLLCVTNPNDELLRFRRVTADLDVSGAPLAAAVSDSAVVLPGRSSTTVPLSVATTVQNLGPQLLGVLRTGAIAYRVHGTVSLEGFLGVDVPYSRAGRLDVLAGGLDLATAGADQAPSRCAGEVPAGGPG